MENLNPALSWPPAFTLKKSARARHVRLKASLRHGLELVVPMRFNAKQIPEILETNKEWILKQLHLLQERLPTTKDACLPEIIHFPFLNQTWKVDYVPSDSAKLRLFKRPPFGLALLGNTKDKANVRKILTLWVKAHAKSVLTKRLKKLSEATGLDYSSVSIRGQRSRWGSCSSDKAISLNFKLLFFPEHLLDHVLIHELCHTLHLNHSNKFWKLVASFDVAWKEHSREIKKADKYVPAWVEL